MIFMKMRNKVLSFLLKNHIIVFHWKITKLSFMGNCCVKMRQIDAQENGNAHNFMGADAKSTQFCDWKFGNSQNHKSNKDYDVLTDGSDKEDVPVAQFSIEWFLFIFSFFLVFPLRSTTSKIIYFILFFDITFPQAKQFCHQTKYERFK